MSKIRAATKADFDDLLGLDEFSVLDWAFLERSASVRGAANVSVHVETEDGRYVVPLIRRRVLGVYPVAESVPFALYGGVLPSSKSMDPPAYVATMQQVSRFSKMGIIFQNPFQQEVLASAHLEPVIQAHAHMVHTEGQVYADLLAKVFEHKMRKNVKRALANNVVIRVGRSPQLVRDFYGMYEGSNARWGRKQPRYGLDFFLSYAEEPFFEVRVAYSGERPAASLVMLRFRNYYFGWFGAMNKELSNTRANDLLHADLIRSATETGIKWVNFGSSANLAGVKKFKESFGATERQYGVYFVGNRVARAALKTILNANRRK
jgi:hypothetical protein